MNVYYAKSVLYAYPHIEQITEQIDELVERKALSSMTDYSPCEEIAQKIILWLSLVDKAEKVLVDMLLLIL